MSPLPRPRRASDVASSGSLWLALLILGVWSWNVGLAVETTLEATRGRDPFHGIESYRSLRPHLAAVPVAGFIVEKPEKKKLHKQLYRAQYAVAPTVLLPVYTPKAAVQWLRRDGESHLIVSARPKFIRFLERRAEPLGYRLEMVQPGLALISPSPGSSPGAD